MKTQVLIFWCFEFHEFRRIAWIGLHGFMRITRIGYTEFHGYIISFLFKEVINRKTRLTHNWTECTHRNFFSWWWYDNCKPFFMIFLMVLCLRNKAEKLHSNCRLFLVPYFQNLILQHLGIEKHSSYLLFERYILVSLSSVDFCCFILEGILFLKIGFTRKSIFYPHPFGGIRMTRI